MKIITQSLDYEGPNRSKLRSALKDFHEQQRFDTGIDWQFQYLWAKMSDEQAMMFLLKYPEFLGQFREEMYNGTI